MHAHMHTHTLHTHFTLTHAHMHMRTVRRTYTRMHMHAHAHSHTNMMDYKSTHRHAFITVLQLLLQNSVDKWSGYNQDSVPMSILVRSVIFVRSAFLFTILRQFMTSIRRGGVLSVCPFGLGFSVFRFGEDDFKGELNAFVNKETIFGNWLW